MSKLLNSGKVGETVLKDLSKQREQIMKNWNDSGLLDGITGYSKSNIAQLLEGEASALLRKENKKGRS